MMQTHFKNTPTDLADIIAWQFLRPPSPHVLVKPIESRDMPCARMHSGCLFLTCFSNLSRQRTPLHCFSLPTLSPPFPSTSIKLDASQNRHLTNSLLLWGDAKIDETYAYNAFHIIDSFASVVVLYWNSVYFYRIIQLIIFLQL